jgi:two-component system response regulator HupR/HoxA
MEAILADEFEVTAVEGPPKALAELARQDILLVVTDEEMPGGSGLALLADMRRRFPLVVGVLVTGHAEYATVQEAMRNLHGGTVVIKPYDPDMLLRQVRNAATMARMRRATDRLRAKGGARPR